MMCNLIANPNRLLLWTLIFAIAVTLSACGEAAHQEGEANAQPVTLNREIPDADQRRGRELIAQYGCGSCHKIPGIAKADGNVGPPLNDWADRQYIAGSLPNTPDNLIYWIRFPQAVEPGTVMPNMDLSVEDARDMAAYLYTLQDAGQISDIFATLRAWVQEAIASEDDEMPVTGEEGGQVGGQEDGQVGSQDQLAEGLAVYNNTCTFCHQAEGQGVEGSFPPLAGSDFVTQEDPAPVIDVVTHGRDQMPAFESQLSSEEITAVVSFIRGAWGNDAPPVSAEETGGGSNGAEVQSGDQTAQEVTVELTVENNSFSQEAISVPAGARVVMTFTNHDSRPHNFSLYRSPSALEAVFLGRIVSGPDQSVTYEFTAPSEPGEYYFQCDVHPYMNGPFTVGN